MTPSDEGAAVLHTIFSGLSEVPSHIQSRTALAVAIGCQSLLEKKIEDWKALSNSECVRPRRVCIQGDPGSSPI